MLTVEPDLDIKAAWLWAAWPHKPAGRNAQDLGVDIVAEANDGRLIAVQCKCQNDGTTLAKRSIDSFMAEAGTRTMTASVRFMRPPFEMRVVSGSGGQTPQRSWGEDGLPSST